MAPAHPSQLPLALPVRAQPVTPAFAARFDARRLGTLVRPGVVLLTQPRRAA